MIHVSHNEIVTVCTKAYEGLKRHCGESDAIANMTADLEMVGLGGISHFVSALSFLKHEPDIPVTVTEHDSDGQKQVSADLNGGSIICHLPALLDYAVEKLSGAPSVTLKMKNCHNRWLAYGELIKLSGKGLCVKASWSNGHSPYHVEYILNAGIVLPDIYLFSQLQDDPHTLTIVIQTTPFTNYSGDISEKISGDVLATRMASSWKNGMYVDESDWQAIKETAALILVESSERSLQGAGGQ
ncbi:DUF3726 domain-containing protein [Parasalinivibrio latis]|uniref:DUF3726 domain-containing protein n=1 Tax=Parasalinivibrio latis TaxID=2952610 RepID=UPI0030E28B0B